MNEFIIEKIKLACVENSNREVYQVFEKNGDAYIPLGFTVRELDKKLNKTISDYVFFDNTEILQVSFKER